uniref:Uncharacterized protein n=1 Tax=viral metagenome TaxID=1070528 RepID=A0A6C0K7Z0_9ZZZZ
MAALEMAAGPPGTGEGIPQLHAMTLFDVRLKQDKARHKAYNQILEQALQKVAYSAVQPNQPTFVYYNVPPFVLGLPALDLKDCVVYVVHQLRNQGYEVRFTYPNLLWISWGHHEHKYLMEKNPIIQSMIPKMATQEKRKGPSLVTMRAAATGAAGAGQTLRAADYTPPAGFVETMERPSPYSRTKNLAGGISETQTKSVRFENKRDGLVNVLDELWKI